MLQDNKQTWKGAVASCHEIANDAEKLCKSLTADKKSNDAVLELSKVITLFKHEISRVTRCIDFMFTSIHDVYPLLKGVFEDVEKGIIVEKPLNLTDFSTKLSNFCNYVCGCCSETQDREDYASSIEKVRKKCNLQIIPIALPFSWCWPLSVVPIHLACVIVDNKHKAVCLLNDSFKYSLLNVNSNWEEKVFSKAARKFFQDNGYTFNTCDVHANDGCLSACVTESMRACYSYIKNVFSAKPHKLNDDDQKYYDCLKKRIEEIENKLNTSKNLTEQTRYQLNNELRYANQELTYSLPSKESYNQALVDNAQDRLWNVLDGFSARVLGLKYALFMLSRNNTVNSNIPLRSKIQKCLQTLTSILQNHKPKQYGCDDWYCHEPFNSYLRQVINNKGITNNQFINFSTSDNSLSEGL